MKTKTQFLIAILFLVFASHIHATTLYVDANSAAPAAPYTSWATAAQNIQDAVDASIDGDQILVTNGLYNTGGKPVGGGTLTTRVALTNAVTVQSVNGASVTFIQGSQALGQTNGPGATRCAYLNDGSMLIGFTLTNGATLINGGFDVDQSAGGVMGHNGAGTVSNCVIVNCTGNFFGGGAFSLSLYNCLLTGNTAPGVGGGGGARDCGLYNCSVTGNFANQGGGACNSYLSNCIVTGNSAGQGGGTAICTADRCNVSGNIASVVGGGAYYGNLNNCAVAENISANGGGGNYGATLVNCTVTYNTVTAGSGGGTTGAKLTNCIVYFNTASDPTIPNYAGDNFEYSCTTPFATGAGNIASDPQLADFFHVSAGSPCRAAGIAAVVTELDIDGDAWATPPSMGCDEYHAGNITGPLSVHANADYSTVASNFPISFTAIVAGHANSNHWDFGDGTFASNTLSAAHSWATPGDYAVVFTAYNETLPGGVSTTQIVHTVQSILYVALNGANPAPPYSTWATAATNIQDAVTAAVFPGSLILVSNGIYNIGATIVSGSLSNRVAVTNPVTLASVNGSDFTAIRGYQNPTNINADDAIRCVYLTDGAALIGFTLANGATRASGDADLEQSGGGAWCDPAGVTISNCVFSNNYAANNGGGVNRGTILNCAFVTNSAGNGGGVCNATLSNCAFTNNSAGEGGGACFSTLSNCTLIGNYSGDGGGGANSCTLNNCFLGGNSSYEVGGGAYASSLNNCTIVTNTSNAGGGTGFCNVNNSVFTANSSGYGAGAFGGGLNNCTVTGSSGIGVLDVGTANCIIANNPDGNWDLDGEIPGNFNYCCTTPLPDGTGNFTADPQLASFSHISAGSPCRGAGSSVYTSGADIDGQSWLNPPSVGCDEFYAGTSTGSMTLGIAADFTNVSAGFRVNLVGDIEGNCSASRWDFGDGTIISNQPYASHVWTNAGDFSVVLRAFNSDFPAGLTATQIVHVSQGIYYVARNNSTPAAPYTNWATAATNIQDAINVAFIGGTVLVTNGTYDTGGLIVYNTLTNRVALNKILTVKSVNGSAFTTIAGYSDPVLNFSSNSVRCVYMTNGATISGFTITNGATYLIPGEVYDGGVYRGGGVWCESGATIISNCIITGCYASDSGGGAEGGSFYNCTFSNNHADFSESGYGGGADSVNLNNCTLLGNTSYAVGGGANSSILNNCILQSNYCVGNGGGACGCTLNNCTLVGNSSSYDGGGANYSALNNCICYYNICDSGSNYDNSTLNYCCTAPSDGSAGAITNEPLFIDLVGGNLRLQFNSPCINAGNNAYAPAGPDLDGNPRIVGGTVDAGAYEYQTPTSIISYAWLQQYGFPADGSADFLDPDHDGMNNYQEWRAGTDPTDPSSLLVLLPPVPSTDTNIPPGLVVTWQSVSPQTYYLEFSTNLSAIPAFSVIQSNITGQPGTTSFTDTNAVGPGPFFYRVGIQ